MVYNKINKYPIILLVKFENDFMVLTNSSPYELHEDQLYEQVWSEQIS